MDSYAPLILGTIFGGAIGALIGRNRKIDIGWSIVLGAILGLIGWIIIACIPKKETEFTDMSKNDKQ